MDRNNRIFAWVAAHPARISALGILPLVAASSTLAGSVLTGSGFLAVLLLSSVSLSLMRNLIPHRNRLVYMLVISSTWVTGLDLLLQYYVFDLRLQLGIYLPLLALNSFLLMVVEKDALTMPVWPLMGSVLKWSVLPISLCLVNGLIREWLVSGHFTLLNAGISPGTGGDNPVSLPVFATATGAFMVTGCALALINLILSRLEPAPAGDRPSM